MELRAVTHDNWLECIALEVAGTQRAFVNPNIFSLAEAYVHSGANREAAEEYYQCFPFALYHGDKMVGFAMVTYERQNDFDGLPAYEIYRLMIEKNHQGRGYGKEAVDALLQYIQTFPCGRAGHVYAEWHPENRTSERLFTGKGFVTVGSDAEGAVMARRALKR